MSSHLVLIEKPEDWLPVFPKVQTLTAREYLGQPALLEHRGIHLINLCRSYRYLSTGYYCSLLANARHHKVLPSVNTITALSRKSLYHLDVEELEQTVQKTLKRQTDQTLPNLELTIYFGQADDPKLQGLARQIFDLFPCPILKVTFRHQSRWEVSALHPLSLNQLTPRQQEVFSRALTVYLSKPWRLPRPKRPAPYDLAILHDPSEPKAPSNPAALRKFVQVGKKLGIEVELIEKKDYGRLLEFDALFIRATTAINHYTYRFSHKAFSEGMAVIDDPTSILRCTNKVFLAELLAQERLPHPKTVILQKGDLKTLSNPLGFPVVLKIPDGSFSRGVLKADTPGQFRQMLGELFKESDLILAQEFIYTPFDWRIGILNCKPLYACRYFMSRRHWQIVKYERSGRVVEGGFATLAVEEVPQAVVDIALHLARKIGDGLYGVDLKQTENGDIYVIEINDNPNLDSGIEDKVLGEELYRRILADFIRRIEERREGMVRL
jgi:glutathione synthase/RimK-type ligase-like ATP-grasp enzyme